MRSRDIILKAINLRYSPVFYTLVGMPKKQNLVDVIDILDVEIELIKRWIDRNLNKLISVSVNPDGTYTLEIYDATRDRKFEITHRSHGNKTYRDALMRGIEIVFDVHR